jgi:hypothetical protein
MLITETEFLRVKVKTQKKSEDGQLHVVSLILLGYLGVSNL